LAVVAKRDRRSTAGLRAGIVGPERLDADVDDLLLRGGLGVTPMSSGTWGGTVVLHLTKGAMGFRRFQLRGLQKVGSEWGIVCTCHNLLKVFRAHRRLAAQT